MKNQQKTDVLPLVTRLQDSGLTEVTSFMEVQEDGTIIPLDVMCHLTYAEH